MPKRTLTRKARKLEEATCYEWRAEYVDANGVALDAEYDTNLRDLNARLGEEGFQLRDVPGAVAFRFALVRTKRILCTVKERETLYFEDAQDLERFASGRKVPAYYKRQLAL